MFIASEALSYVHKGSLNAKNIVVHTTVNCQRLNARRIYIYYGYIHVTAVEVSQARLRVPDAINNEASFIRSPLVS